jgi:hypothetical protein
MAQRHKAIQTTELAITKWINFLVRFGVLILARVTIQDVVAHGWTHDEIYAFLQYVRIEYYHDHQCGSKVGSFVQVVL